MGERLLMAILDGHLMGPSNHIWLYHHWFGYDARFLAMLADVVYTHKLYRPSAGLSDAVKAFLSYDMEGFHITDSRDDRNYMACVDMAAKKAVWFDMDKWRRKIGWATGESTAAYADFVDAIDSSAQLGTIDAVEATLAHYLVDYRTYNFSAEKYPELLQEAVAVAERQANFLRRRLGPDDDFTKFWEDYADKLKTMLAEVVARRLG